jgi:hypothetical protein
MRVPVLPHDDITPAVSRQELRRLGILEIRRRVKKMFPNYKRREVHSLAMILHQEAWRTRDIDLIQRAKHGKLAGRKKGADSVRAELAARSNPT